MTIAGGEAWDSKVICDPIGDCEWRSRYSMVRRRRRQPHPDQNIRRANWFGHTQCAKTRVGPRGGRIAASMRIGITCYPTYGGSGIVATELGLELATRGHDVHFITYANPIRLDPGTPRIHYHEVEVSTYPLFQYPPYCLALASRMAEVAEDYELDLLHVHYAIPHSTAAMLAQQMLAARRRLPFITTLHGTDITIVGMDRSYFPITKFSIEKSDGITSVSQDVRRETYEVFGVTNEIRVIHNFVNTEIYRPIENRPNGEKRLMHISNFRPVKRVTDCVRILAEVREGDAGALVYGGRRAGPSGSPSAGARIGPGAARDVSGQAGSRGAAVSQNARAADAERNGVVRIGGAGRDGVRGATGRHAGGRVARAGDGRRGWVPGAGGRYRGPIAEGDRAADQ